MPICRILRPIRELSASGKLGGLLLLLATTVSLLLSNSTLSSRYLALWELHLGYGVLNKTVAHWVNEGLMAIFFFLVGLEIKREVIDGELSEPRQALLPALAALGGVAAPALMHLAFTHGTPGAVGWAVPTATDIAFSLGILALLGKRVPACASFSPPWLSSTTCWPCSLLPSSISAASTGAIWAGRPPSLQSW